MSKKVIFSIFLIITGVIAGLLILFTYGRSGGNQGLTLGFLSVAILCIMTGTIVAFTRLLDRTVNPLVEEIHKDIEDDLQDLKERRFTNTHGMIILVGMAFPLSQSGSYVGPYTSDHPHIHLYDRPGMVYSPYKMVSNLI
jgi:hypothetical protein